MTGVKSINGLLKELRMAENSLQSRSVESYERENAKEKLHNYPKFIRTEVLAWPTCRQLKPWPNPKLEGPHTISRAALKAKMSSRLEYLSQPRTENIFFCETYREPIKPKTTQDDESISSRIIELSKPRLMIPEEDVVDYKKSKTLTTEQYISFKKNLKKLSTPRPLLPSPIESIRLKKGVLNEIRLKELSKPSLRPTNINEITFEELYTIKKSALKYIASDRIKKLSKPKQLNEETLMNLNFNPRAKLLNSLKYKASDRILDLAKPMTKIAPKSLDIKADAYKVNPKALKARCSPRVAQLAKPIKREFPGLWKKK